MAMALLSVVNVLLVKINWIKYLVCHLVVWFKHIHNENSLSSVDFQQDTSLDKNTGRCGDNFH